MPELLSLLLALLPLLHWTIVILIVLRIVSKRRPTGVALGWVVVLVTLPYIGAVIYFLFGDTWLSSTRQRRSRPIIQPVRRLFQEIEAVAGVPWGHVGPMVEAVGRLGAQTGVMPLIRGNDIAILDGADESFPALIEAIDNATRSVELLFYIWQSAGRVREVEAALARAVTRGVHCRVLVDGVGSADFLDGASSRALKEAGVDVAAALRVQWLRARMSRMDVRNHRKLAIIDERIAFTGSLNMTDPAHFKQKAGVGPWVDVMARVQGPAVAAFSAVFEVDWCIETGRTPPEHVAQESIAPKAGTSIVQVVPSGPDQHADILHRIVIQAIYEAREQLTITTPYFIPDEAMLAAIASAAMRGVKVTLVIPERVDSRLVALASNAYYADLLAAGVSIRTFRAGLLHAKTITIDDCFAMVGTVNMDRRSFSINFELSALMFDENATTSLRAVERRYIEQSVDLRETAWSHRSRPRQILENTVQLLAPLL